MHPSIVIVHGTVRPAYIGREMTLMMPENRYLKNVMMARAEPA